MSMACQCVTFLCSLALRVETGLVSRAVRLRCFLLQKNLENLLQVQKLLSGRKKVAILDNEEDSLPNCGKFKLKITGQQILQCL